MKKKLTVKKVIPFAVLFVIVAYLLIVQGPIKKKTEQLQIRQAELETDILLLQPKYNEMQLWDKELQTIYATSADPISIPDYDNIQNIINEMNTIFSGVNDFKIVFSDVVIDGNIATRNIAMNFTCSDYNSLHSRIQKIHDSRFKYQIYNLSIELKRSTGGIDWGFGSSQDTTSYSVTINVVAYEYVGEKTAK